MISGSSSLIDNTLSSLNQENNQSSKNEINISSNLDSNNNCSKEERQSPPKTLISKVPSINPMVTPPSTTKTFLRKSLSNENLKSLKKIVSSNEQIIVNSDVTLPEKKRLSFGNSKKEIIREKEEITTNQNIENEMEIETSNQGNLNENDLNKRKKSITKRNQNSSKRRSNSGKGLLGRALQQVHASFIKEERV